MEVNNKLMKNNLYLWRETHQQWVFPVKIHKSENNNVRIYVQQIVQLHQSHLCFLISVDYVAINLFCFSWIKVAAM